MGPGPGPQPQPQPEPEAPVDCDLSLEEISELSQSPHGRLQLRAKQCPMTLLLSTLECEDPSLLVSTLQTLTSLCSDCDCALELAQRGLHTKLTRLSKCGDPRLQDTVYECIQAAGDGLPPGYTFPLTQGLQGCHPPLPHTFTFPWSSHQTVTVITRSETSLRLQSQEDVGRLLWPAARVMARWLLRTAPSWIPTHCSPSHCRTLELGAGMGLTGLVASQVVGNMVLSDYNPSVLANLRYNQALRSDRSKAAMVSPATPLPAGHTVQVKAVDWMDLGHCTDKYDVILGSDVVCNETDGQGAARAVSHLLAPRGVAYFLLPPPDIRFGVTAFAESLTDRGMCLVMEPVATEDLGGSQEQGEEVAVGAGQEHRLVLHTIMWKEQSTVG